MTHLFIPGTPIPQGSSRAFMAGGRPIITADNTRTRPWRADIHAAVRDRIGDDIVYPTGPVGLRFIFIMPRRKAEPNRITPPHTRKPDIDKLQRSVMDAITGLIFTDDSQCVDIAARKRTAEIGEQPGMHMLWFSVPEITPDGAT